MIIKLQLLPEPGDEVLKLFYKLTDNRSVKKKLLILEHIRIFYTRPNDMNQFYANNFDESWKS